MAARPIFDYCEEMLLRGIRAEPIGEYMKIFALAMLALAPPPLSPYVMECNNVKFFVPEENGGGRFEPSDFTIKIRSSSEGLRGYVADLQRGSETAKELDVEITEPAKESVNPVDEFIELAVPTIRWSDVATVRVGEVGVKQNQDDAGGMAIFELYDKNKALLGKVAQIGWGFGVCQ